MNVLLRVRSEYPKLSKSQRQIADYMFEHVDEFVNLTAHEIGEKSGTSSASVIRFAQYLDFVGLEEMKRQLVIDASKHAVPIDPIIQENDSTLNLTKKLSVVIENGINDLFYQLDVDKLDEAIGILQNAHRVFLFGVGASALPAYDLYHKLNRINKTTFFNFDNHMMLEFVNYTDKNDVVIVFSYSGNSLEVIYPAETAQRNGAHVIAVTRNPKSRLAKAASVVVKIPDSEHTIRVTALTSKLDSLIIGDLLYFGYISPRLKEIEEGIVSTSKLTSLLKTKE